MSQSYQGYHHETGQPIRLTLDDAGRRIASVETIGEAALTGDAPVLAPALWDIQVNGYHGVSFSDPSLTVDQVRAVAEQMRLTNVARFCPTLITALPDAMLHGVRTIAAACEADPLVRAMVLGIHLEGPSISERDGYRGAHPIEAVRDPAWDEFERLQEASGGRVVLITLAPERDGSIDFIRKATASGVAIALGHTAADGPTIRAAVEAGARLSTHLGNGIADPQPRHPNPIWEQGAEDRLFASFIADLDHLHPSALKVLGRAKGVDRTIFVSDVSPLAGCQPGRYGSWEVTETGRVVVAGTPYLAGAACGLQTCLERVAPLLGWGPRDLIRAAVLNPARLLGRTPPTFEPGQPANLLQIRTTDDPARPVAFGSYLIEGEASDDWQRR